MPAAACYPTYRQNLTIIASILFSLFTRRSRNFSSDARRLIKGITPFPVIHNLPNIPAEGPFLLTLNHYSRPGFNIFWAAAALSSVLPRTPIWLMTSAWTDRTKGLDQARTWLTRKLFTRLADIYGFVTTAPMPPAPEEVSERAASLRRLHYRLRDLPDPILCLAPEGMDFSGGVPGFPPDGTGKFILQVLKKLNRILPVGVYEEDGKLILNFGNPYELDSEAIHSSKDKEIAALVMQKIAALLPARMRGQFSENKD